MNRKSPIKHRIQTHKRTGKIVHSYLRGHGSNSLKIANPRLNLTNLKDRIMYHVAPTEFEEKILKEGLIPTENENRIEGGTEGDEPEGKLLYFSDTQKGAIMASEELTEEGEDSEGEKITIFEVKIPRTIKLNEDPYSYGEGWYIRKKIPPNKLRVVKRKARNSMGL